MTERLYYTDSYRREFQARVVDRSADARTVYLDRTLFYPASGGQPFDLGSLAGIAVVEVVDEEERIAHRLAAPLADADVVAGEIDWPRRFDHMQQHSGQHLLSAVFEELYGLHTVSFHLGAESATIDLEGGPVEPRMLTEAEARAAQLVSENRAVDVRFEDASAARGLRKAPDRAGKLRIVSIDGLDRSACGGTHVRATGEIGPILCAWSSCAEAAPFAARGRISKRSPKSRSCFRPRWTKWPPWWPRNWKRPRPARKRGASWNSTSQPIGAGNSTPPPNLGPTVLGAPSSGWTPAIWKTCAPWRRTSPRRRKASSWQR
jgi:Ser-tRNA(Ala) deacylase AlaX